MNKKMIQLDNNGRERVEYTDHVLPISVCIDQFDSYYQRQWACHWHEEFEFGVLMSGKLRYTIYESSGQLQEIELVPGDGIFINAKVPHSAIALEANTVIDCFVLAKTLFNLAPLATIGHQVLAPINESGVDALAFRNHVDADLGFLQAVTTLCSLRPDADDFELHTFELTLRIWRMLSQHLNRLSPVQNRTSQGDTWGNLKAMIQYIHEHYQEPVTIEQLIQCGKISRSECFRLFRDVLDKTPIQFLTEYRFSMASMMLVDTAHSVGEISDACGFSSPSYFGSQFKKYFKMTPKEYRNQYGSSVA